MKFKAKLFVALALLSAGIVPVHAGGSLGSSTNVIFHALWQFESDTSFDTGLMVDGSGSLKLRACAADQKRGANGEVSRFQILPTIWKQYSKSSDFVNPEVAWEVAERIFTDRMARFVKVTGRQPTAFDLYVLWNAPGHFERVGFDAKKVRPVVVERARRFANLVERFTVEPIFKTASR